MIQMAPIVPGNRQRNCGPEDVIRVKAPLGSDEPLRVSPIALRRAIRAIASKKVRISAGECNRIESMACGESPLTMPLPELV